jgi:hypothetical protein
MSAPIREFAPYCEPGGRFEVNPELASQTFTVATEVIRRYVGDIAVRPMQSMHVEGDSALLLPRDNLLPGEHSILYTGRYILGGSRRMGIGNLYREFDSNGIVEQSIIAVQHLPASSDSSGALAIVTSLHEMAHDFGLEHCPDESCTMNNDKEQTPEAADILLGREDQFCGGCADDLVAYSTLATSLQVA